MSIKIKTNYKYKSKDLISTNQEEIKTLENPKTIEINQASESWHSKIIQRMKDLRQKYALKPKQALDPEVQRELYVEQLDRMDKGTYQEPLGEKISNFVGKLRKPKSQSQGSVEESFTMEDLKNYKTIGERVTNVGDFIKSKLKPKIEQNLNTEENEDLENPKTEGKNLKDKLITLKEKLKIPKSKQEAIEVVQNAIENFKDLSPKDKAKMIGLGLAAVGFSAVAIHAAIPVILGSTTGGLAGTGFGTFTGLGMGQSVLGFGAIKGVEGVAYGVAATMAKVYAGSIAAGAIGGGLLSLKNAGKILNQEKLIVEPEVLENTQSIEQQVQSKEISPELQAKIDIINTTPNMSDNRKQYEIGELIKDAPKRQIVEEQTQETVIQEPLEVVNAKLTEIAIETDNYDLWLNTTKNEGFRLGVSEDDMDLTKVDFMKAKEAKYKEELGFRERKTTSKSLDNLEVLKAKSLVTEGLESVFDRCPPTNKLTIDGQEFLFSDVITSKASNYPNVIIWSNKQGKLMPRLIYKSQSSGTWRMDLAGRSDGGYGKGDHYTESSKLVSEIVSHLDNNVKILDLSLQEYNAVQFSAIENKNGEEDFDISYLPLNEEISGNVGRNTIQLLNKRPIKMVGNNTKEQGIINQGSFEVNSKSKCKSNEPYNCYIEMIENIDQKFVPDFKHLPVKEYQYDHTIIGPVKVLTYLHKVDDEVYEYDFAVPKDGSLPFINGITQMNSEVMYVGIPKNVADFGSLQMKPMEYKFQIPETFEKEGGLITPKNLNNKSFDDYIDIRPFLIKSPVMQAFLNR